MRACPTHSFPTAMHVSAVTEITKHLLPELVKLRDAMALKSKAFEKIIKIGRTHLQVSCSLTRHMTRFPHGYGLTNRMPHR